MNHVSMPSSLYYKSWLSCAASFLAWFFILYFSMSAAYSWYAILFVYRGCIKMGRSPASYILILFLLFCQSRLGTGEHTVVVGVTITSPPIFQVSSIVDLLRRDNGTCSYGSCAGVCLEQGAFCCNPGGTTVTPKCKPSYPSEIAAHHTH